MSSNTKKSMKQNNSQKSLNSKLSNQSGHRGDSRISISVRSLRGQEMQSTKETKRINNLEK